MENRSIKSNVHESLRDLYPQGILYIHYVINITYEYALIFESIYFTGIYKSGVKNFRAQKPRIAKSSREMCDMNPI